MKNGALIILFGLVLLTLSLESTCESAQWEGSLDLSNGYRVDDFDWNVAGNLSGTDPNIYSELTWRDIEIYQVRAGARFSLNKAFYLRTSAGYGWVFDGDNQDSDYDGDGRTLEYSRSNNKGDDGDLWEASLGLGYQLRLFSDRLTFIPIVGFAYREQNLTMTNGTQTIATPGRSLPLGPIENLDSTYETRWTGPWLGFEMWLRPSDRVTLFAAFEHHWADYHAEANWNLRPDLARPRSFEHDADAKGTILSLGAEYLLRAPWSINLTVNYQDWSADAGTDRLFYADGSISETRLNEVNWDAFSILVGLTYRFHYGP